MIARGYVGLVVLVNFVLSMPVTPGHMEQKDVEVMKCIVEVIADVLTKPHPIPASPDCLQTLSTDDRLVTLLRHRNFLQELQDIAAEGANERVQKHPDDLLDHVTSLPENSKKTAAIPLCHTTDDQSMLVAMEKPEEDAEKRGVSEESSMESEESEQESQKRNNIAEEEENDVGNHISMNPEQKRESQEEATIRDGEKQEEMKPPSFEKKEENELTHNKEGNYVLEANPELKQSIMEDMEEARGAEKERTHSTEEQKDEEEEEKREVGPKYWSRLSKLAHKRVETGQKLEEHKEALQHSKERMDQEGELWRSPEEQELQIMAQTEPEDKRDEEGSAGRKTEDADIESLAAIESELESVAQKLHELRRG
ncbi:Chromogranin-A -like protein [Triplophysa tibetana]|uniref:Chromogranin-A n=1 Tax=Triplophysa tibetana TaxID=1572043 RepID=A0A5A9NHQ7_9TELE|nr:Chromogranin-A -like protein [Triplophysa tibetana]